LRREAVSSPSATARVAAAKRLLDEEPRPDVSDPLPQLRFKQGISLTGILVHSVACGVLAPDVIADVAILEQAYTLVARGSGHVREAAASVPRRSVPVWTSCRVTRPRLNSHLSAAIAGAGAALRLRPEALAGALRH
jgi:hypothetical protein